MYFVTLQIYHALQRSIQQQSVLWKLTGSLAQALAVKVFITSPKADQHLEPNQNGKPLRQSKVKKKEQRGSRGELHTQKCSHFERKYFV